MVDPKMPHYTAEVPQPPKEATNSPRGGTVGKTYMVLIAQASHPSRGQRFVRSLV